MRATRTLVAVIAGAGAAIAAAALAASPRGAVAVVRAVAGVPAPELDAGELGELLGRTFAAVAGDVDVELVVVPSDQ